MARVYNFSAGPSMLPLPVLEKAASELTEYGASGQSVMEMSHRSPEYEAIIGECESLLRSVMGVPDNYKVLFIQGGASMQFAMVPLNLLTKTGKADYVVSGQFSGKAYEEAQMFGDINLVATSKADNFSRIPELDKSKFNPSADYFHICQNNTIYGTYFHTLPETGAVPLVADLSSCIISEPVDVSKYGVIYAGVQKNMAPAGMSVVIIREDLIGEAQPKTPTMLKYSTYSENQSMYNTPPAYTIYMLGLVLKWVRDDIGGLEKMKEINKRKAAVLYDYLDNCGGFYKPCAQKGSRSMMNVTFVAGSKELDNKFCAEALKAGFRNLAGHRAVGGMRASIYNAMPEEGIVKLVEFMKGFAANN